MNYAVNHAAVIGSGTMGGAIAAHLANAGIRVHLLDIVPRELTREEKDQGLSLEDPQVRNRIVRQGLDAARKAQPASFYSERQVNLVEIGNLEDDFHVVAQADWVVEVILENLKIKQSLMERIDQVRKENSIVSSNTSGIPISLIAEGRSDSFQKHFLGTHFFNPPRYLKLLEVIPTEETLSEVVDFISHFGEYRLGKGVVLCKDTPNFIANRLGFASGAFALEYILINDFGVKEVDSLTGPLIGRPKTATFRLLDLVGLDVWKDVGDNLAESLPEDDPALPYLQSDRVNELIRFLVERGWLGKKTRQGFYKQVVQQGEKEFWPLDLSTREHKPAEKVRYDSVKEARGREELGERLTVMLEAEDRAGDLVRNLILQELSYASHCIPEIADTPKPIDDAMRWGFGRQAGPFEIWDLLGIETARVMMDQAGFPPADWVDGLLAEGITSFYRRKGNIKQAVYHPGKGSYIHLERSPQLLQLEELKFDRARVLSRNPSAALIDLGDGVVCVEFQTKMNTIDEDTIDMMEEALDRVQAEDLAGVVIGSDDKNFSAGANLFDLVMAAQNELWDQLEDIIRSLQQVNMRMRYFPRPVVSAPAGLALGGGAEITMHGSRVVAAAELVTGLVEVGAGLIPAGGGTKEMLRRIVNPPMRTQGTIALPYFQQIFEQVGQGEVARSALQAQERGILGSADRVVINRDHLLAEAKREVLHLADSGYTPPPPEKIYAAGRDLLSALKVSLHQLQEGGYITEYERAIGTKLVHVLSGGNLSKPAWLEEQYFLDLEREAFLSLCGEQKTQERMWSLLRTGKVLRN